MMAKAEGLRRDPPRGSETHRLSPILFEAQSGRGQGAMTTSADKWLGFEEPLP